MLRRRLVCLLAGLVWLSIVAQGWATERPEKKMKAFVSIPPQAYFVERVGGGRVDVKTLVQPGQDAHTYEPSPKALSDLAEARALFLVGLPFEATLARKIAKTFKGVEIVDTRKGITLRDMREEEIHSHGEDEHGHGKAGKSKKSHSKRAHKHEAEDKDPHIWLDPNLVKIQAQTISDALVRLDPSHADDYRKNLKDFQQDLDALNERLTRILAPLRGKKFFVFHPAYGYFADAYGLIQVPVEMEGKEPGARRLAALIKEAKEEDVKVIFVQPQLSAKSAQTLASAIGCAVASLDPLARDYMGNMKEMADKIEAALKPPQESRPQ